MRRRAAVELGEQRRMEMSVQLEAEQEAWKQARKDKAQRARERTAAAIKKHVIEHEDHLHKERERIRAEADATAEELHNRWSAQEADAALQREKTLEKQRKR